MRVAVKNGYIVAEWEGKPDKATLNVTELVRTLPQRGWDFFDKLRSGDYDNGCPYVDLRYRAYPLPSKPFYALNVLSWVNKWANACEIEIDESFKAEYERLMRIRMEVYPICQAEYEEKMTKLAEERWEEKRKETDDSCDGCRWCADVIDGDLFCDKYGKYLDIKVGEKVTPSGQHLMFASHGIKCSKCKEMEAKQLEEEKAKFIAEYVNEFKWQSIEDLVAKAMNKGVESYV